MTEFSRVCGSNPRLTETEFAAVLPLLGIADHRIEMARRHLVAGHSLREVAKMTGCSHQAVSSASTNVLAAHDSLVKAMGVLLRSGATLPEGWDRAVLEGPREVLDRFRAELLPCQTEA